METMSNTVEGIGEVRFIVGGHHGGGIFLEDEEVSTRPECVGSLEYGKFDQPPDEIDQEQRKRSALYSGSLSFMDDFLVVNGVPGFLMKTPQLQCDSHKFKEEESVTCCRFSASSTWIVAGYGDGSVRVWDGQNGKLVNEMIGIHSFPVCDVATLDDAGLFFLRFGKVASIDSSGACHIWDLVKSENSRFTQNLVPDKMHGDVVLQKPFLATNKAKVYAVITVGNYDRKNSPMPRVKALQNLEVWVAAIGVEGRTAQMVKLDTVTENFDVTACQLSPSGISVLLGYMPHKPLANHLGWSWIWEDIVSSPKEPPFQLMGGQGVWSKNSNNIATWDTMMDPEDATEKLCKIRIWELSPHRQLLKTLQDDSVPCWCCFAPAINDKDRENLVACVVDHGVMFVRVYELGVFLPIYSIRSPMELSNIDWTLGCRSVPTLFQNIFSVNDMSCVTMSRNHALVGMSSKNGTGCIIDVMHGVIEMSLKPMEHLGKVTGIVVGKDTGSIAQFGRGILAMTPFTRSSTVGDRAVELNLKFNDGGKNVVLKFSGDGQLLGALQLGATGMSLYGLEAGWHLNVQQINKDIAEEALRMWSFALSFDGKWLATLSQDKNISLWDINSLRVLEPEVCPLTFDDSQYSALSLPKAFAVYPSDGLETMTFIVCSESGDLQWLIGEMDSKIPSRTAVNRFLRNVSVNRKQNRSYEWFKRFRTYTEARAGPCGCRFSADAKRGLLMKNELTFDVWDTIARSKLQTLKYQVPVNVMRAAMDGRVMYPNILWKENELVGMNMFGPTRTGDFVQETLANVHVVSDDGQWVLASNSSSFPSGKTTKADPLGDSLSDENGVKLAFFHVKNRRKMHILEAPSLAAAAGFAVSLDGRRIACLVNNTTVRVWSPHATKGLIPDVFLLEMNGALNRRCIRTLLDVHGYALFNMPDQTKMPLFMQVVSELQAGIFDEMIDWVIHCMHHQSLSSSPDGREQSTKANDGGVRLCTVFARCPNILELAFEKQSPGMVKKILDAMMHGVANTEEKARILQSGLERFGIEYKSILNDLMDNKKLFVDIGTVWVPADAFRSHEKKIRVETHPHISKPIEAYEKTFKKGKGILVPARVRSLPIPNAAQLDFDGLIAKLLLANAPREVYGMAPLRHIIKFKWTLYAKRLLINDLVLYFALIVFFSIYSFLTGKFIYSSRQDTFNDPHSEAAMFFLFTSMILGLLCFYKELKQMGAHRRQGSKGIWYWAFSPWNWIELLSYMLLLCGVPSLHFSWASSENVALTYALAVEIILLWWKFMYFLQPFSLTGPVVIAIGSIIKDTVMFLLLASTVLFGFTSAFYLLFRHQRGMSEKELIDIYGPDDYEDYSHAFRTFEQTLFTMFSYTFGTFDIGVLYNIKIEGKATPHKYVGILFFLIYMLLMAIIFLNLLIAIMGDSYNHIISNRKLEFLKARAGAIHDIECMMTDKRKEILRNKIQKYIHVIEPMEDNAAQASEGNWAAQLQDIKKSLRADLGAELSKCTSLLQHSQQQIIERLEMLGGESKNGP